MAASTSQDKLSIDEEVVRCFPSDLAHLFRLIPVRKTGLELFVVADRSLQRRELSELQFRLECPVIQDATVAKNVIDELLRTYYHTESEQSKTVFVGIDALVEEERPPNVVGKKGYAAVQAEFMRSPTTEAPADAAASKVPQHWIALLRRATAMLTNSLRRVKSNISRDFKPDSRFTLEAHARDTRERIMYGELILLLLHPAPNSIPEAQSRFGELQHTLQALTVSTDMAIRIADLRGLTALQRALDDALYDLERLEVSLQQASALQTDTAEETSNDDRIASRYDN